MLASRPVSAQTSAAAVSSTATSAATKAAATTNGSKGAISIEGSSSLVLEFFVYAINNILYQRGLYPEDSFKPTKKYNLTLLVSCDDALSSYLDKVLSQLRNWVAAQTISRLVMVISSKESGQVLERWQFDIKVDASSASSSTSTSASQPLNKNKIQSTKTFHAIHFHAAEEEKRRSINSKITADIASVMRQITMSVSFLPTLNEPCTFNILAYTDRNATVPDLWVDSDARMIAHNAEQVRLRSFNTSVHQIEGLVSYRIDPDMA